MIVLLMGYRGRRNDGDRGSDRPISGRRDACSKRRDDYAFIGEFRRRVERRLLVDL